MMKTTCRQKHAVSGKTLFQATYTAYALTVNVQFWPSGHNAFGLN